MYEIILSVVPRKGDVDRNTLSMARWVWQQQSSPARGTWIEMHFEIERNPVQESSPARGTWIEIRVGVSTTDRVESSPARGTWIEMQALADGDDPASGRPPQGGRG